MLSCIPGPCPWPFLVQQREAVCEVRQEKVAGPFCPHRSLRGIGRDVVMGAVATWGGSTNVLGSEAEPRALGPERSTTCSGQGGPGSWDLAPTGTEPRGELLTYVKHSVAQGTLSLLRTLSSF